MDQQNKTKTEAKQNKVAELSDRDLEQVAGGTYVTAACGLPLQNPVQNSTDKAKVKEAGLT